MQALMIKDLAVTEQLDRKAMSAVRGGMGKGYAPYYNPMLSISKSEFSFGADQLLAQSQNTEVNNGNNVAFASGISSNVNPHQSGHNTISFNH